MVLLCILVLQMACSKPLKNTQTNKNNDEHYVILTMQKHLTAVSTKNMTALAETLSPNGEMQLILPASEVNDSVAGFLKFHEEWFKSSNWAFETKILNSKVGTQLAMVVVEAIYREPMRNGQPYFNRMTVSYTLEKIDGHWYVIKDHASSVEKSTDKKTTEN